MTSDTQAWNAPLPPADDFAPLPRKQRRHLARIAAEISALLVFTALGVFAYTQHGDLESMTAQRDSLKADLGKADDTIDNLRTENKAQAAHIKKCSVIVPIAKHNMEALRYMGKAVSGGTFGALIWLPLATSEIKQATNLITSHQSYDGELFDLCGPGSVSGT